MVNTKKIRLEFAVRSKTRVLRFGQGMKQPVQSLIDVTHNSGFSVGITWRYFMTEYGLNSVSYSGIEIIFK